jgi:hypothetical protein
MKAKQRFPVDVLTALREGKGLRIRAGTEQHRFIGIWVVVVKDRACFPRSAAIGNSVSAPRQSAPSHATAPAVHPCTNQSRKCHRK